MDHHLFCSYGSKAIGEVPKNSSIIYEIELVKVRSKSTSWASACSCPMPKAATRAHASLCSYMPCWNFVSPRWWHALSSAFVLEGIILYYPTDCNLWSDYNSSCHLRSPSAEDFVWLGDETFCTTKSFSLYRSGDFYDTLLAAYDLWNDQV